MRRNATQANTDRDLPLVRVLPVVTCYLGLRQTMCSRSTRIAASDGNIFGYGKIRDQKETRSGTGIFLRVAIRCRRVPSLVTLRLRWPRGAGSSSLQLRCLSLETTRTSPGLRVESMRTVVAILDAVPRTLPELSRSASRLAILATCSPFSRRLNLCASQTTTTAQFGCCLR